ncbi:MAG: deferrochelatase/peroxidase EfeB [Rhodospirillales bacterium]|nr:deferrochelatase/peroxidase EfeB [Rhodospirillales bacterium]
MICASAAFNRRRLLAGMGGTALALIADAGKPRAAGEQTAGRSNVARAPISERTLERQPFYGAHQAGVLTPRPETGMVAAFDVLASTPDELVDLFRTLSGRIAFLMQGGTPPARDPRFPPADSGILGPVVAPDNLAVTVSLGASMFDDRFGLAAHRPAHLVRMMRFQNDALDASRCHGDLSLQICSNTADANIHALRDILKTMPDSLLLRWMQDGSVPVLPEKPGSPPESARNFLGFRDGSANPDVNDEALMNRIVWTAAGQGEPAWCAGGTYQAVRIIRNFVERWDRTPLGEQERIIGRQKASGSPLAGGTEGDEPAFENDLKGEITPLDAHIRLANNRNKDSQDHLILRRPFNYSNGVTKAGQLDQGLLFIAYQSDLERGFITVQRQLDGEPLEEYIKPVGGGFFFTLPGVANENDFLGGGLLSAAGYTVAKK